MLRLKLLPAVAAVALLVGVPLATSSSADAWPYRSQSNEAGIVQTNKGGHGHRFYLPRHGQQSNEAGIAQANKGGRFFGRQSNEAFIDQLNQGGRNQSNRAGIEQSNTGGGNQSNSAGIVQTNE